MTFEIGLLFFIIATALVLFSIERIPADVVAVGVLVTLVIAGLLPVEKAFLGYGSDAVILIFGLLVLTAALGRTGVIDLVGKVILRRAGNRPNQVFATSIVATAGLSSFISNTAAAAFFIPIVFGLARRARMSPSKLLMPVAFAAIISSSVTLVATSTNIVVSGLMIQHGLAPMGMFELTPVGIPIALVGLVYMYTLGRKLIPSRRPVADPLAQVGTEMFFTEAVLLPGSIMVGKTLEEAGLGRDLDLTVVRVVRDKSNYLTPDNNLTLKSNDLLLLKGSRQEILKVRQTVGIDLKGDVSLSDPILQGKEIGMVEVIVMIHSPLIGRTLRGVQFREKYGLQVLAINRHGETISHRIAQVVLQLGDILLVQGHHSNISAVAANNNFRVLGQVDELPTNFRRAPIAIMAFVGALLLATFNILSLPVAALLGIVVVFLTRCITPEEAYREMEWKVIILIGAMLGVGAALESTGAALYLANLIIQVFGDANPLWILGGFFVITMLLTQPMSNQAAAAVVVPIALSAASQLGLNPRTFAIMIAVAASCSYLTPLEPACLMVYGPGDYRFRDFLKVGSILTVIIFFLAMVLVPMIWPL